MISAILSAVTVLATSAPAAEPPTATAGTSNNPSSGTQYVHPCQTCFDLYTDTPTNVMVLDAPPCGTQEVRFYSTCIVWTVRERGESPGPMIIYLPNIPHCAATNSLWDGHYYDNRDFTDNDPVHGKPHKGAVPCF